MNYTFEEVGLTTPPASPSVLATYLVGASATGAWSGHDGEIAVAIVGGASPIWAFAASVNGDTGVDKATATSIFCLGTDWYLMVAPWVVTYSAANATAINTVRSGRIGNSATLAGPLPSDYYVFVTQAEMTVILGASAGTYKVYPVVDPVTSASLRLGVGVTGTAGATIRAFEKGDLVNALAIIDGDGAKRLMVGWENDASSPGALANSQHLVHVSGWLVKKLT